MGGSTRIQLIFNRVPNRRDHDKIMRECARYAEDDVLVCVPFVSAPSVNRFLAQLGAWNRTVNVRVLTDGTGRTVCSHRQLQGLRALLINDLPHVHVTLRACRPLHSKVYLFGARCGIVTSANLTEHGLQSNLECGVMLTDRDDVAQLRREFEALWSTVAKPVTLDDVQRVADLLPAPNSLPLTDDVRQYRQLGGEIPGQTEIPGTVRARLNRESLRPDETEAVADLVAFLSYAAPGVLMDPAKPRVLFRWHPHGWDHRFVRLMSDHTVRWDFVELDRLAQKGRVTRESVRRMQEAFAEVGDGRIDGEMVVPVEQLAHVRVRERLFAAMIDFLHHMGSSPTYQSNQ